MTDVGGGGSVAPALTPDISPSEPQNGATQVSDPTPAQLEAEGADTVAVVYQDETYTFPLSLDDLDGDVLEAYDERKMSVLLKAMMSPADWARFKATKPKVKDYPALFEAYAIAAGYENSGE